MVYFDSSSDGTNTQCLLYNELDGIGKFLESEVLQLLDYNIPAYYYNLDSKSIFSYKGVEEEDFYKLTFWIFIKNI